MGSILKFLGCGSAFNPSLGNTSAYFEEGKRFFLIDCGETVFTRLYQMKVPERYQNLYVLITHTHADHVGSLASLISYCYFVKGKKVTIIHPNYSIVRLLKRMGVGEELYILRKPAELEEETGVGIREIPVKHAEDLRCYGYLIRALGHTFFYSGDSYEIPRTIINKLINGTIDFIYQDTTEFVSSHLSHFPLPELAKAIPEPYRKQVYCMHFTNDFSDKIKAYGFGSVKPEEKESRVLYVSDGLTHSYEGKQLLRESPCRNGGRTLSAERL